MFYLFVSGVTEGNGRDGVSLEAATGGVLIKFNKVTGFAKMRLQHRGFRVNIVKSLRVPTLKNNCFCEPKIFLGNPRGRTPLHKPCASGEV